MVFKLNQNKKCRGRDSNPGGRKRPSDLKSDPLPGYGTPAQDKDNI